MFNDRNMEDDCADVCVGVTRMTVTVYPHTNHCDYQALCTTSPPFANSMFWKQHLTGNLGRQLF